uniref:Uncharacterized protein n=1 Tax=Macrostomum lignano TaxID=282301 RepID=A0A1I8GDW4_9PLAT
MPAESREQLTMTS